MKLTVQERILLHLYESRWRDPGEDRTRIGIAKACGVRVHSTPELYGMIRKDFVEREMMTVLGKNGHRLIAFSLTRKGEIAAEVLIREIEELHEKVQRLKRNGGV